jgi:putative sterol carrier protein
MRANGELQGLTMDMTQATEHLRDKVLEHSGLNAILKFDCGADGVVVIDGRTTPSTVDNSDREADCTVVLPLATLVELLTGVLDPTTAYLLGRFKLAGDLSVAMKLQRVI